MLFGGVWRLYKYLLEEVFGTKFVGRVSLGVSSRCQIECWWRQYMGIPYNFKQGWWILAQKISEKLCRYSIDILHCFHTIISLCIVNIIVGLKVYGYVCVLHLIAKSVHASRRNYFATYTDNAAVGNVIIGAKSGVVVYFFRPEVAMNGSKTRNEFEAIRKIAALKYTEIHHYRE